jgi:hypothetical protein
MITDSAVPCLQVVAIRSIELDDICLSAIGCDKYESHILTSSSPSSGTEIFVIQRRKYLCAVDGRAIGDCLQRLAKEISSISQAWIPFNVNLL